MVRSLVARIDTFVPPCVPYKLMADVPVFIILATSYPLSNELVKSEPSIIVNESAEPVADVTLMVARAVTVGSANVIAAISKAAISVKVFLISRYF